MVNKEKEKITIEIPSKSLRVQHAMCYHKHSLMDPEHLINGYASVTLNVSYKDVTGSIYLDPVYGSFKNVSEIDIPDGETVNFYCPTCNMPLILEHVICEKCGAAMFGIYLPHGGRVEACTRNGCQNHNLKLADGKDLLDKLDQYHTLDAYI